MPTYSAIPDDNLALPEARLIPVILFIHCQYYTWNLPPTRHGPCSMIRLVTWQLRLRWCADDAFGAIDILCMKSPCSVVLPVLLSVEVMMYNRIAMMFGNRAAIVWCWLHQCRIRGIFISVLYVNDITVKWNIDRCCRVPPFDWPGVLYWWPVLLLAIVVLMAHSRRPTPLILLRVLHDDLIAVLLTWRLTVCCYLPFGQRISPSDRPSTSWHCIADERRLLLLHSVCWPDIHCRYSLWLMTVPSYC